MTKFMFLDTSDKNKYLPLLFDILHDNMNDIAPSALTYDEQKTEWLAAVSPALEKAPRKVIMCLVDETPVGFIQYYTNGQMLMIEEIQLKKRYQRTLMFHNLCLFLCDNISHGITIVEAYCDRRNISSQSLMTKLGMTLSGRESNCDFLHLRGSFTQIKKCLKV